MVCHRIRSLMLMWVWEIADAPTNQVGDVVMLVQPVEDLECVRVDVTPRDRVVGPRNDDRLHHLVEL